MKQAEVCAVAHLRLDCAGQLLLGRGRLIDLKYQTRSAKESQIRYYTLHIDFHEKKGAKISSDSGHSTP